MILYLLVEKRTGERSLDGEEEGREFCKERKNLFKG